MNLLLDTHIFLWYLQDDPTLSDAIADILESTDNKLYLSIASLQEIAIKIGIGKLQLQPSFDELRDVLIQFEIEILPILFEDTSSYLNLPLHHRDPFDRMLVAQAIAQSLILVSQDAVLDAYGVQRLWTH